MEPLIGRARYRCKYPLCKNGYYDPIFLESYKNKRFFSFPSDPKYARMWREICNISNDVNTKNFRLCRDHFYGTDFFNSGTLKRRILPKSPRVPIEDVVVTISTETSTEIDDISSTDFFNASTLKRRTLPKSPRVPIQDAVVTISTETSTEIDDISSTDFFNSDTLKRKTLPQSPRVPIQDAVVTISTENSTEIDDISSSIMPDLPASSIDLTETTSKDNERATEDMVVMISRGTSTETLNNSVPLNNDTLIKDSEPVKTSSNFKRKEIDFSEKLISYSHRISLLQDGRLHSQNSTAERVLYPMHENVISISSKVCSNNEPLTKVSTSSKLNREEIDYSKKSSPHTNRRSVLEELLFHFENSNAQRTSHQAHRQVVSRLSQKPHAVPKDFEPVTTSNFNREEFDCSQKLSSNTLLREVEPHSLNLYSEQAAYQIYRKACSKLSKVRSTLTTARAELNSIRKLNKGSRDEIVEAKLNDVTVEFVNSHWRHVNKINKRRWSE